MNCSHNLILHVQRWGYVRRRLFDFWPSLTRLDGIKRHHKTLKVQWIS